MISSSDLISVIRLSLACLAAISAKSGCANGKDDVIGMARQMLGVTWQGTSRVMM